jgi:peptide/nickel transport system substrate-binding protein
MKAHRIISMLVALILLASIVGGCGTTPAPVAAPTTAPTAVPEQPTAAPTAAPEQPTVAPTTASEQPTAVPTEVPPTEAAQAQAAGCPKEGGQLVVGLSYEPSKIDPHRTAAENGVLPIMQACESLVIHAASGEYLPWLAESWDISPDGLSYTFHLRQGISFQDGTPFNAEAVKYNLDRIMDPATQSEEAIGHMGPYESTEVVDEYTAVVHLSSPFAVLLDGLAFGYLCMVSPTAAQQWGPEDFQDHFVGTGPFVFKEWKRGEYILLEKNPNYWGGPEMFKHHGNACLDSILFKFISEDAVRSGTLETGETQVAQEIPAVDVERLKADPNIDIQILPSPGTGIMLLFNVSKPPTDDPLVRQALEYGIDQKAIAQILYQDIMGPTYGPLSSVTPCYWSGAEQMYAYDPEKAKELLDQAGWKDENGDGIREKDGTPLLLEFPTHGSFPMYRDPPPIVQSQLQEIGVQVDVQNLAVPAWLEAGRSGNLNIGIVDWRASDPDTNLRLVFHSSNADGFEWNHHSNTQLDDLLTQGMVTTDQAQRCQIYEQVQQIIMNDAMIKPLHEYSAVWGLRSEVKDLQFKGLEPSMFWAFDAYLDN